MAYKAVQVLNDILDKKPAPPPMITTGLEVCTPETAGAVAALKYPAPLICLGSSSGRPQLQGRQWRAARNWLLHSIQSGRRRCGREALAEHLRGDIVPVRLLAPSWPRTAI
ncbi:MAG: hypothetical protein U1E53_03370 [Dongiaceae bacterium]